MKVAVFGARGRMGAEVVRAVEATDDLHLVGLSLGAVEAIAVAAASPRTLRARWATAIRQSAM